MTRATAARWLLSMSGLVSSLSGCGEATMDSGDPGVAQGLEVRTAQGPVRGRLQDGSRAFLGLAYAAPPVGENRFRAPQPPPVHSGVLDASETGPACPQLAKGALDIGTSEDCLTLNIWAPSKSITPRPVMVFLHGGGFNSGSGGLPLYEGKHLSATQDVVVVTLNYRLGPLGFFSHSALSAESGQGTGNFGLLDQQAALAWVRDNIAAFGGDKDNVTLFGESAGGMSVCYQLVSPKSAGLFRRAIVQSGPCSTLRPPTQSESEAQGEVLAKKVGCTMGDAATLARCLRSVPLSTLMTALPLKPEIIFGDGYAWTPSVGNPVLPVTPQAALAGGQFHRMPIVVGANKDEGTAFVALGVKLDTEAEIRTALASLFSPITVDTVIRHYGSTPIGPETGLRLLGDAFVCDARRLARWTAAASVPTFYYHFTREFAYLLPNLGAFHGAELPYLFHTPLEFISIKPHEEGFSAQLQGYWARFAATGDPNGSGAVSWPKHDRASDRSLRLDLETRVESGLRQADCDFWDTLLP